MTAADAGPPIITLTTDFGFSDTYVAEMKAVILQVAPHAVIIDVSHDVLPQQVVQALYLTQRAWPQFSQGAVHVAVVDPGVGGDRVALALETPRGFFVGPDNGVLSAALLDDARPASGSVAPIEIPLSGFRAVVIAEERYMRMPVSATFHGRDVFAPAAAHLARGVAIDELGPPVKSMLAYGPLRAKAQPDGSLCGSVVHIDRFGNVITDARAPDLPQQDFIVEIAGHVVHGPARTYGSTTDLAGIVSSDGYLELARPGRNAAGELQVAIGDQFVLRPEA